MTIRDPSAWMWDDALALMERAERLQRHFFRLQHAGTTPSWEPPVDVFELGERVTILVALPGVEAQQVEVAAEESALVVRGVRPIPERFRKARIARLEIPQGYFERRIELAPGKYRLRQHSLKDGCLELVLDKRDTTSETRSA